MWALVIRSSIVPRELGKRASGLVQPLRAWCLNLVLRPSWLSVLVSISLFGALASTAHVGSQQQLSSSACYQSSPRTAYPTLSPPLRRPRSTVPPLALTFLINNDEYHQECREGLHGPLRDGLAGGVKFGSPIDDREAFVVPVLQRQSGIPIAVPLDFVLRSLLEAGKFGSRDAWLELAPASSHQHTGSRCLPTPLL